MENKTYKEGIKAEHGLSIYIETDEMNILFDAGATDSFLSNAGSLGIDLARVDMAVISHGHYDHTGGFPGFCRVNKKLPYMSTETPFADPSDTRGRSGRKRCPV